MVNAKKKQSSEMTNKIHKKSNLLQPHFHCKYILFSLFFSNWPNRYDLELLKYKCTLNTQYKKEICQKNKIKIENKKKQQKIFFFFKSCTN